MQTMLMWRFSNIPEYGKNGSTGFSSMVASGTKTFGTICTGTLFMEQGSGGGGAPGAPGAPGVTVAMPWNQQLYTTYANLQNQIYTNTTGAEQASWETSLIQGANTTIQNFIQDNLTETSGVAVFSGGLQLPSGTPSYSLNPGTYAIPQSTVQQSISQGGSGTHTLTTSVSNVTDTSFEYGKTSSSQKSYSYSANAGGGWWLWNWSASASGSKSEETKRHSQNFRNPR